ncbi:MAG: NAD(P)-dependent oxidoreductase [Acidimicrobiia bacterium]
MRVLCLFGPQVAETIAAAVPAVEVVAVDARSPGDLPDTVHGDVLFGWSDSPAFPELAGRVPWIHLPGTGVDGLPPDLFEGRTVTCSRGLSAIPIAEFVVGAILAFEKRFPQVWLSEPPERWNFAEVGELAGRTVGLVGIGGIGTAIAGRLAPFGVSLRAVRRNPARGGVDGVELAAGPAELVASADHLVLAAPATDRTRHLVDAELLAHVKPGMHLVNVARGALVDHDALRVALGDGRIACATLDTVDPEPLPAGHWLYAHPRVRLSAHVSWGSPRAVDRIVEQFVANLRRRLAGEQLAGVVDAAEGY